MNDSILERWMPGWLRFGLACCGFLLLPVICLAQEDQSFEDFGIETWPLGSPTGSVEIPTLNLTGDLDHATKIVSMDLLVIELHDLRRQRLVAGQQEYDEKEAQLESCLRANYELFVAILDGMHRNGQSHDFGRRSRRFPRGQVHARTQQVQYLKTCQNEFLRARLEVLNCLIHGDDVPDMIAASFEQICQRLGLEVSDETRIRGLLQNRQLNQAQTKNDWRPPKVSSMNLKLRRGKWTPPDSKDF